MSLIFKRGSLYTRDTVHEICYPGSGRTGGGPWDTGYVRVDNNLIVFMNIGIPGRTGHDFDNQFDERSNTLIWFGKPNTHSSQPLMKKLLQGELTPHFFARWVEKQPFTYLGIGQVVNFEDGVGIGDGRTAIRMTLNCQDVRDILEHAEYLEYAHAPEKTSDLLQDAYALEKTGTTIRDEAVTPSLEEPPSSFVLEKHLEDYLCQNWETTQFGRDYDIYGNGRGRQFPTDTGPLDILAQRKDGKEFLVVELKRDMASDVVVGQTLRYMGYIEKELAKQRESVKGCIIATGADQGLKNALLPVSPKIDFYEYRLSFEMNRVPVG